ncbi:YtxH domain-containing protein [Metabacillus arenae]|uniref:YtxH domain-containing protein n=1 Tax=Metabacillus arenae TaxID=2771434 RepID=A0A926RW42_9BACI|nr:YtxH domain-containing protein [Metabacillus arenae]MBD1379546.1 YtxH domain-containing protein [Metabacillus arenae]
MAKVNVQKKRKSKLVKGIVIGGIVGGAITLLDATTRNKVKNKAVGMKDSSVELYQYVRENPSEVKDQVVGQVKTATKKLEEAITDAQSLYERVNNNIISKVSDIKQIPATAKEAKGELKGIGSKVKDAGSELSESVEVPEQNENNQNKV